MAGPNQFNGRRHPRKAKRFMAIIGAGLLAACTGRSALPLPATETAATDRGTVASTRISAENAHAGTNAWNAVTRTGRIAAYTDTTSVNAGEVIRFAVSTTSPSFGLTIYRLGWYA